MGVSMGKTGRSGMSEINITPMIDVLLVLLVIFMVAQQILLKSIDFQLPKDASAKRAAPPQPPIVMEIEPGGIYRVNTRPLSKAELGPFLTRTYAGRPDKVIFVQANGRVRYGDVVGAMDVARGAGVKVIGAVVPQS